MEFEYDSNKSSANKKKHGIDFEEIQILWVDPERLEIPAKTEDEERYHIIGKIEDKVWSSVITYRGNKIRMISARRSHKSELRLYESEGI